MDELVSVGKRTSLSDRLLSCKLSGSEAFKRNSVPSASSTGAGRPLKVKRLRAKLCAANRSLLTASVSTQCCLIPKPQSSSRSRSSNSGKISTHEALCEK